jgi:hypothetical protein
MTLTPNPWDDVQIHNGKLVGMLTDKLAQSIVPDNGGRASSTQLDIAATIGAPKVYKKQPSKFKR